MLGLVVIRDEVDGLLVQIIEQRVCDARHAHLGIAHRRRRVAIDRAEVALAIDQHVPHRERLRHTHDGVVHGGVTMRVVFTDDITDHTG